MNSITNILRNTTVKLEDVRAQTAKLGLTVDPKDAPDFHIMLSALDTSAKKILAMDDFSQPTDLNRFPRTDVHAPTAKENPNNAWAYKYVIKDTKPVDGAPLAGKTICFKDCVEVAGVPQILGTDAFSPWTPKADATVVSRVLKAGAIAIGNATCENQCCTTCSNSACTGNIDNPYGPGHSAGGSSSGCGYLVGSGKCDLGIGADQGGSIRIPSSHCGIVGLKPTFGLVPYTGIGSLETNIDHTGPMTPDVLSNALLLKVISGQDGFDDRQAGAPTVDQVPDYYSLALNSNAKGMKIGVLKEALEIPCMTANMKKKFYETIDKFKALGIEVVEISIPEHATAPEVWMIGQRIAAGLSKMGLQTGRRILKSTDYYAHTLPMSQAQFDKSPVNVKNNIINCLYLIEHYPSLYVKSINLCLEAKMAYDKALEQVDVLVMPTVPFVSPRHGSRDGTPIESIKNTIGLNSNTGIFNMTGHPAMSLPVGFLPAEDDPLMKFPVGFEIVSGYYDEPKIYAIARAFEKAYDWKE